MDGAVEVIRQVGKGTFMAKADIRQTYRIVLVHPEDCYISPVSLLATLVLSVCLLHWSSQSACCISPVSLLAALVLSVCLLH